MSKYLFYLIAGLSIALFIAVNRCSHNAAKADRLSDNQRSLLEQISFYQTKDSLNAASVERLTLTVGELKSYLPALTETVEDLGLKVGRLQSVAQTATQSDYPIRTVVKDSLVYRKDTIERWLPLRCIDFDNRYLRISGCEEEGVFSGSIRTVDTLVQVVHRVPRKLWFIRWGTKAIRQEVLSKNPYTSIVYSKYIELKN